MSSHHIIRDQQEPAVLIHRIGEFPIRVLHSLLEWSPTVICCEPSISPYTEHGFKLDVALVSHLDCDFWNAELQRQHPIKIIANQSSEFLMAGLTLLKKDNHKAVHIVSDEFSLFEIIQECLLWSEGLDVVILTEKYRHIIQRALVYRKWVPGFSRVGILPLAENGCVSTLGFDNDLANVQLTDRRELAKSSEGEIVITSSKSPVLISEEL